MATHFMPPRIRLDPWSLVCDLIDNSEKAYPTVRWRRKATDLLLPRQPGCLSWVSSFCCFCLFQNDDAVETWGTSRNWRAGPGGHGLVPISHSPSNFNVEELA